MACEMIQRNVVGAAYMLIDELPGKAFDSLDPTEEQTRKVYDQLTWIQAILAGHPFDKIGALNFDDDGHIVVGPIVSDRTGTLGRI